MESYFHLNRHNTNVKTEVLAGVSSFLATAYVIVVNPTILSQAGMPFSGVLTATVLVSFFSSVMMGFYARNPILVAPGMGLNAFFTYSAVLGMGISWQVALGAVFWSGVVFLLLSLFNVRTLIVRAIPKPLRYAIAAGIGLFITLIGFANAKFIVANPSTIIGISPMTPALLTFLAGLLLTAVFIVRNVKGGILLGILFTTLASYPIGRWWGTDLAPLITWQGLVAAPDFSLLFQLDLINSFKLSVVPDRKSVV